MVELSLFCKKHCYHSKCGHVSEFSAHYIIIMAINLRIITIITTVKNLANWNFQVKFAVNFAEIVVTYPNVSITVYPQRTHKVGCNVVCSFRTVFPPLREKGRGEHFKQTKW